MKARWQEVPFLYFHTSLNEISFGQIIQSLQVIAFRYHATTDVHYICWCSEYHRYCKKYTFHSRWRAEYIFPGDHDIIALCDNWEKHGQLMKKRRKLHFGICYGAICESSIYLIVKCNVNFVTPHDVVVSDQRSFWNQRKVLLRNGSFMLMV